MELKVKKENVLKAAEQSATVKAILEKLHPEAFEMGFDANKIYAFKSKYGDLYKLHRVEGGKHAFIELEASNSWANGSRDSGQEMIDGASGLVVEFDNVKDFANWILENS